MGDASCCLQFLRRNARELHRERGGVEHTRAQYLYHPPQHRENSFGNPLRGISVDFLAHEFQEEIKAAGFTRDSTIHEIEAVVFRGRSRDTKCPQDGRWGSSYVDSLPEGKAGIATQMLSYSWHYTVAGIVDSLVAWCEQTGRDAKKTFIWICCACINQHRVFERRTRGMTVPFETFEAEFASRVEGVKHVLALMWPWDDPTYLKRVWCIFEFYKAIDMGEHCTLDIIMPPDEKQRFFASVLQSCTSRLQSAWDMLARVHIEQADATILEDREHIMRTVHQGSGIDVVNKEVRKRMRQWFANVAVDCADQLIQSGTFGPGHLESVNQVGMMLTTLARIDDGIRIMEAARAVAQSSCVLKSHAGAVLLRRLAVALRSKGVLDTCFSYLDEAQAIHEILGTTKSPEFSTLLWNFGGAKRDAGDLDASLACLVQSRDIRERAGAMKDVLGASLIMDIGRAIVERGDLDAGLGLYLEAQAIRESTETMHTLGGAQLLGFMGELAHRRGDLDQARAWYAKARELRESFEAMNTPHGAGLLVSIGSLNEQAGDIPGALACYEEARCVLESVGAMNTQCGFDVISRIRNATESSLHMGARLA